MILLNFIKSSGAKKLATFPHFDQRGNRGGSSFSACVFLAALSVFANAQDNLEQQIHQAIDQHLQTIMKQHAQQNGWQGMRLAIENTPLTRTNQLAPCPGKINVSGGSATKLARQQLTLECNGIKGWPIKISTDMKVFLPVVISNGVIDRSETIKTTMLKREEMEITRLTRGFYHRMDEVTRMSAKRRIRANQVLSPDLIDQPQLIKRGEKIKIIANRDGISASMPGEALEKGGEGQVIRVKNLSSGKTIEAKVIGVGVVTSTF